ncbi:MAG TPA: holo-ACP synthase, partial [Acidimicrobiales bacterium]|nr:holo-ACP synthase [Acidimicrobiales bacterium]
MRPPSEPAWSAGAGGAGIGRVTGAVRGPVLGVGVDAVDPERLRRVLARRPTLEARLFTPAERDRARGTHRVARLSTRFAAKEATWKALGVGLGAVGLQDVEMVDGGDRAPRLCLHGRAASLARAAGVRRWHVSVSHTDRVAIAVVLAE